MRRSRVIIAVKRSTPSHQKRAGDPRRCPTQNRLQQRLFPRPGRFRIISERNAGARLFLVVNPVQNELVVDHSKLILGRDYSL